MITQIRAMAQLNHLDDFSVDQFWIAHSADVLKTHAWLDFFDHAHSLVLLPSVIYDFPWIIPFVRYAPGFPHCEIARYRLGPAVNAPFDVFQETGALKNAPVFIGP
jgi:hypothetical protein